MKKSHIFPDGIDEDDPAQKIKRMLDGEDSSSSEMNKIDEMDHNDLMSDLGSSSSQITAIQNETILHKAGTQMMRGADDLNNMTVLKMRMSEYSMNEGRPSNSTRIGKQQNGFDDDMSQNSNDDSFELMSGLGKPSKGGRDEDTIMFKGLTDIGKS
jgi:hypothetical protein